MALPPRVKLSQVDPPRGEGRGIWCHSEKYSFLKESTIIGAHLDVKDTLRNVCKEH